MVALNEEGAAIALAQRRRDHDGGVLLWALAGVADLGTGDLEDELTGIVLEGGANHSPGSVVGHAADVDRGRRLMVPGVLAAGHVEVMDRGRQHVERLARLPDDPARGWGDLVVAEDRAVDQPVDLLTAECFFIIDMQLGPADIGRRLQVVNKRLNTWIGFHRLRLLAT